MRGAFPATIVLDTLNYFIAILPKSVHFDYLLRWVLKIAVNNNAAISGGFLKICEHCGLLAEISAEIHSDNILVLFCCMAYLRPCAVLRAVVYK